MLDKELKEALIDRLEGWELVEFLQLDIRTIVEEFEDEIEESLADVLEFAGIKGFTDSEQETNND